MARQFTILTVGQSKKSVYTPIIDDYIKRIRSNVSFIEIKSSDFIQENKLIRDEVSKHSSATWVALDSSGKTQTSEQFSTCLEPNSHSGFIIGGADGLDKDTLDLCNAKIAFGSMIWPHQLARLMLVEQLYRAEAIWSNHPYHRASIHRAGL